MAKGKKIVKVAELKGCARCGGAHRNLLFRKLRYDCGDLTHWTLCPSNGEPIMLRIEEKKT